MQITMSFENRRDQVSQIWIEPTPDCFNLKPGEKLTMEFDCSDPDEPLHVELTERVSGALAQFAPAAELLDRWQTGKGPQLERLS